jgi:hypothetical protein
MLGAVTNVVRDAEFRIGIQRNPSPNVAPPLSFFFGADVLALRSHERPDFIALQAANPHIADVVMMVGSSRTAKIAQQIQDGMLSYARHAASGIDGDTLY